MSGSGERDSLSFEAALSQLEAIVRKLETGEASLEESIRLYEDGVKLQRHCEEKLGQAEARIEQIRGAETGTPVLAPFQN